MTEEVRYPIQVPIDVAWGEMDAFGHVNNIIYFRYFETARMAYFRAIGLSRKNSIEGQDQGPILAHTACQFIQPLVFPHHISACTRVKSIGSSSLVMENILVSQELGTIARGSGVIVMYDYTAEQKIPLSKEILQAIEQLEERSFS